MALLIDFGTGAIYLPEGQVKGTIIRVNPKHLIPEQIRSIIYEEMGIEIDLNDPRGVVKKLDNLSEMEEQFALFEADMASRKLNA